MFSINSEAAGSISWQFIGNLHLSLEDDPVKFGNDRIKDKSIVGQQSGLSFSSL